MKKTIYITQRVIVEYDNSKAFSEALISLKERPPSTFGRRGILAMEKGNHEADD